MMIIGCDFHPNWQQIAWLDRLRSYRGPPAVRSGCNAGKNDLPGIAALRNMMRNIYHRWTKTEWVQCLADGETQAAVAALRQCTHTGRPLGTSDFVAELEKSTLRLLAPRKGGRPKRPVSDSPQLGLTVVA